MPRSNTAPCKQMHPKGLLRQSLALGKTSRTVECLAM